MNKLELIKEFNKYHPGYGVEWGYSTYIGGMTDTGHWLFEVLINESETTLKLRLKHLEQFQKDSEEYNKKNLEEYERVKKLPEEEQDEYYKKEMIKQTEEFKKIRDEYERYLMWSKK